MRCTFAFISHILKDAFLFVAFVHFKSTCIVVIFHWVTISLRGSVQPPLEREIGGEFIYIWSSRISTLSMETRKSFTLSLKNYFSPKCARVRNYQNQRTIFWRDELEEVLLWKVYFENSFSFHFWRANMFVHCQSCTIVLPPVCQPAPCECFSPVCYESDDKLKKNVTTATSEKKTI